MEHTAAVKLITKGITGSHAQRWADLGAGTGTFTHALATLLPPGSTLTAVDKDKNALRQITSANNVDIQKLTGDFLEVMASFSGLDGVLMANALHYVPRQKEFLSSLRGCLLPNGILLVVEYDMDTSNTWVPFPLSFNTLQGLITTTGFKTVELIGKTASRYQKAGMYAAVVK